MRTLVFAIMAFILFSCQQENDRSVFHHNAPEASEISRIVEQVNARLGMQTTDVLAAFSALGSIEAFVGTTEKEESPFLKLIFSKTAKDGPVREAIFTLELDELIDFPAQVQMARVTYLKNQLLVEDMESGFSHAFFVEDGMETDLRLKMAATDCVSLMMDKRTSIDSEKIDEDCSCKCQSCFNPLDCGSSSASCTCGSNSHSITCRVEYNAECTECS